MEFLIEIKTLLENVFGSSIVQFSFLLIGLLAMINFLYPYLKGLLHCVRQLRRRFDNLLTITEEFQNNHGSTIKDKIDVIHKHVIDIRQDVKIIDGRTMTIMSVIGDNSMSVGMYETDNDGNCIFVNNKWTEITGMSADDAKSYGWINSIHYNDREEVQRNWEYSVNHSSKFDMVYRIVNIKTHKESKVRSYAIPIKDSDSRVIRFVGAIILLDEGHCQMCPSR